MVTPKTPRFAFAGALCSIRAKQLLRIKGLNRHRVTSRQSSVVARPSLEGPASGLYAPGSLDRPVTMFRREHGSHGLFVSRLFASLCLP